MSICSLCTNDATVRCGNCERMYCGKECAERDYYELGHDVECVAQIGAIFDTVKKRKDLVDWLALADEKIEDPRYDQIKSNLGKSSKSDSGLSMRIVLKLNPQARIDFPRTFEFNNMRTLFGAASRQLRNEILLTPGIFIIFPDRLGTINSAATIDLPREPDLEREQVVRVRLSLLPITEGIRDNIINQLLRRARAVDVDEEKVKGIDDFVAAHFISVEDLPRIDEDRPFFSFGDKKRLPDNLKRIESAFENGFEYGTSIGNLGDGKKVEFQVQLRKEKRLVKSNHLNYELRSDSDQLPVAGDQEDDRFVLRAGTILAQYWLEQSQTFVVVLSSPLMPPRAEIGTLQTSTLADVILEQGSVEVLRE